MFTGTSGSGTHGSVTADWATYFTMNSTAGRGWIFRQNTTPTNVASISNTGNATFNGTLNSGAITSTGDITSAGFFKATGSNLKFSAGGNHIFNVDLNGKIYPQTHNAVDLGFSSSLAFRNLFLSGTITSGTNLYLGSANKSRFSSDNNGSFGINYGTTGGTATSSLVIYNNTTASITLNRNGSISSGAITASGDINTTAGGYQINGSTVIESNRNLSNVVTATVNTLHIRGENNTGYNTPGSMTGGLSLWSAGATTSQMMFKPIGSGSLGNHGFCTDYYNTYFVMDTTNRGWVFRNATTATNVASISNTGGIAGVTVRASNAFQIGTTTVIDASKNLTSSGLYVGSWSNSTTHGVGRIGKVSDRVAGSITNQIGGSTSAKWEVVDYGWTTVLLNCTNNGTFTASGNVTAYSDERLKENIQTLDGKKALQMRGVSFTKDGEEGSGVIAQEVEKIAPELVITADDEMGTKSVAYGNLVGYLIETVKDLKAEIDELKERLDNDSSD